MTDDPQKLSSDTDAPHASADASATMTEVLTQGAFKVVEAQRKSLRSAGIRAEVICPPGVNLNG